MSKNAKSSLRWVNVSLLGHTTTPSVHDLGYSKDKKAENEAQGEQGRNNQGRSWLDYFNSAHGRNFEKKVKISRNDRRNAIKFLHL